ncbi:group III truncated hemoglobin [Coralliovum pocilloporae]|uniref:group III truncated hemoglobin n=1 Tax=Coralliovum pocilloporae TaxID=3066369 RepID=UPI003307A474
MSLNAYPKTSSDPLHPSITEEQISDLVDCFYGAVRQDERLGPVFEGRIAGRWDEHLGRMKLFWGSVLLRDGGYKGQPMVIHKRLDTAAPDDFRIWLTLFRAQAQKSFEPEAARLVIEAAERIAQSLWLGMFGDPFSKPPCWMKSETVEPSVDVECAL